MTNETFDNLRVSQDGLKKLIDFIHSEDNAIPQGPHAHGLTMAYHLSSVSFENQSHQLESVKTGVHKKYLDGAYICSINSAYGSKETREKLLDLLKVVLI